MKTTITHPGGQPRPVKNLGWLLRHARQVSLLDFTVNTPRKDQQADGVFSALLDNGTMYRTTFASLSVFLRWIDRPVFSGVELRARRESTMESSRVWQVGDPEFRDLLKLDHQEQRNAFLP